MDLKWLWWIVVLLGWTLLLLQGLVRAKFDKCLRRTTKQIFMTSTRWWRAGLVSVLLFGTVLSVFVVESSEVAQRESRELVRRFDKLADYWQSLEGITSDMLEATKTIADNCLPVNDDQLPSSRHYYDAKISVTDDDDGDDGVQEEEEEEKQAIIEEDSSSSLDSLISKTNETTLVLQSEFDEARRPLEQYVNSAATMKSWMRVGLVSGVVVPWFVFMASLLLLVVGSPLSRLKCDETKRYERWLPTSVYKGPSDRETKLKMVFLRVIACWATVLWLPTATMFLASLIVLAVYSADFCWIGPADILREEDERNRATAYYLAQDSTQINPLANPVTNCSIAVQDLAFFFFRYEDSSSATTTSEEEENNTIGSLKNESLCFSKSTTRLMRLLLRDVAVIENATVVEAEEQYTSLADEAFYDQVCRKNIESFYASYLVLCFLGVAVVIFLLLLPAVHRALRDDDNASTTIKKAIGDTSTWSFASSLFGVGPPPVEVVLDVADDSDDEFGGTLGGSKAKANDWAEKRAKRWHSNDLCLYDTSWTSSPKKTSPKKCVEYKDDFAAIEQKSTPPSTSEVSLRGRETSDKTKAQREGEMPHPIPRIPSSSALSMARGCRQSSNRLSVASASTNMISIAADDTDSDDAYSQASTWTSQLSTLSDDFYRYSASNQFQEGPPANIVDLDDGISCDDDDVETFEDPL